MINNYYKSFVALKKYCEQEQYKGWDPYDGLNSKLFKAIPFLYESAFLRLAIIQGFKISPLNLRNFAMVPKEYNPKGIGLLLLGYCNVFHIIHKYPNWEEELGTAEQIKRHIVELADLLIVLQSKGYSGACWGYNFDWQARRLFLFPKYTPTIVATTFCALSLIEAYKITGNKCYLDTAISSSDFVVNDLHRTRYNNGFLFSYSPLKGNDQVFNASLLGSSLLSCCYYYTKDEKIRSLAEQSVLACCSGQRVDGAWRYGLLPVQNWVDSFHTGYNIDALITYQEYTGDMKYNVYIQKGFNYYICNFFDSNGRPKYYDNKVYPIDIHCPGQLLVTLSKYHKLGEFHNIADKVLDWTIQNMQDSRNGYFYYQIRPYFKSKIPYMRWSNAFMFYSMSYFLLNR